MKSKHDRMISHPKVRVEKIKGKSYVYLTWGVAGKTRHVYCGRHGRSTTTEKVKVNKQIAYLEQAEAHAQLARDLQGLARRA